MKKVVKNFSSFWKARTLLPDELKLSTTFPTTVDQLMAISDVGQIMPPKSTWFEPKLRSGLFVHTLEG